MIGDIVDISKLSGTSVSLKLEVVTFKTAVQDALERFNRSNNLNQPVTLNTDELPDSVQVRIDMTRLDQVITNLLSNAIRYSSSNEQIIVAAFVHSKRVMLRVTDGGMGIPPEDLPYIFDCFFRGSAAQLRSSEGMGLGLYICRRLIEAHGGKIRVAETSSKGTAMEFWLPIWNE